MFGIVCLVTVEEVDESKTVSEAQKENHRRNESISTSKTATSNERIVNQFLHVPNVVDFQGFQTSQIDLVDNMSEVPKNRNSPLQTILWRWTASPVTSDTTDKRASLTRSLPKVRRVPRREC